MKTKLQFLRWLMILMFAVSALGTWAQTSQTLTQTVCIGSQPYLVDLSPISGATYTWTVSGGGLITGNGTRNITIDWTTAGGPYTVSVITTANGCAGPSQTVAVTVVPQPIGPTLNAKTPNLASVCIGTDVSATFNSGSGGVGCSDAFEYRFDGGAWSAYSPGANLNTTGHTSVEIQGQRNGCTAGAGCTGTAWVTLASWIVNPVMIAGTASSTPTLCVNTILTAITHTTTRATGIGAATGLPAGVTAAWAGNVITISGTPTESGTFNYTIPLTGGCGTVNATGTITVTAAMIAGTASSTPTLCVNTILTAITHTTTRATGIGAATGLPAGVTAAWASNVITISGTPTESGTFNYTIPLTGGCGTVNATGTITVNSLPTTSPIYHN